MGSGKKAEKRVDAAPQYKGEVLMNPRRLEDGKWGRGGKMGEGNWVHSAAKRKGRTHALIDRKNIKLRK